MADARFTARFAGGAKNAEDVFFLNRCEQKPAQNVLVSVKLFNAVANGDQAFAKSIHFKFNALWNALRHDNLPACVKYVQARQGLPMFYPPPPMECVTDQQKAQIDKHLAPLLSL